MTPPKASDDGSKYSGKPNFLLVVVLSGVVLILIFICAYFLVGDKGRKLLPGLHHDPQPHSYFLPSAPRAIES